ncbi:hypothetical protein L227DRAFT_651302 [Lentinus tigrinus ALCF2SS1-6]|uniref:Uncharacterized protein n=1 Tax=Lentinus tigrinus ALCF2SS1-6 TaxID=1328759 RepID=A0A5C2SIG0_9APHY|nr:hypothetical protein L227DRAFT_651302 [Lentinus tigrinus ALCF2SS1-6]
MAAASPSTGPPYYLLIAHSQSLNNPSVPASTSLSHPVIEYHYADDPANTLLPRYPGEHVLVLDYDPARPGTPTVKSLSADLVISAVKVADAPGAAVAGEPALRNNNMYVIETMTKPVENAIVAAEGDEQSVHAVLARFKQRNAALRRILDYPGHPHAIASGVAGQDAPASSISPPATVSQP